MSTLMLHRALPSLRPALEDCTSRLADSDRLERFITRQDQQAFAALVYQHGPMVLGVCRRILRHEAEAEDAFQATFLVLLRKASSIIPRQNVGNWLYGVAYLTATKARAMKHKRTQKERSAKTPTPTNPHDMDDLQAILDEELQAMPYIYRSAIVLCDLEGKSIRQAAEHLRCSYGTVGSRLTRGRALLSERVKRRSGLLSASLVVTALANTHAEVPTALAHATSQTILWTTTSPAVLALANSVLTGMLLAKLKVILPLVFLFACLTTVVAGSPSASAQSTILAKSSRPLPQPAPKSPVKLKHFVWAVAYTPDGKSLIMSEGNGLVRLWDTATNQPVAEFKGPQKIIRSLSISPDGNRLAGGGDEGITWVWDLATRKVVYQLKESISGKTRGIPTVTFSPDGKFLAVAFFASEMRSEVRVYEAETGKGISYYLTMKATIPYGAGRAIAFDPTSKTLAMLHHGISTGITLINVTTGKSIKTIDYESPLIPQSVAFSPDGKRLATGGVAPALPNPNESRLFGMPPGHVKVWDLETGNLIDTLVDNTDGDVKTVAYTRTTNRLIVATTTKLGEPQQTPQGLIGKLGTLLQCYDAATHEKLWYTSFPGGMVFGMSLTDNEKCLAIANSAGAWIPVSMNPPLMKQIAMTPEMPPQP